MAATPTTNILSFDVEDWFQVENYASLIQPDSWDTRDLRVPRNMDVILGILDRANVKATFFTLGWIAQRLPELVKAIVGQGHEIASHGWSHQATWNADRSDFAQDIVRAKAFLEDLTGLSVLGYRAPTFSITRDSLWALEDLATAGYKYDSSIFPIHHDRYGIPTAPLTVHRRPEGVWEIPLSVWNVASLRIPVAGGGYFRLYPRAVTRAAIRHINREGRCAVVYLHPWEFDPYQPRVKGLGYLKSARHHIGISRNTEKLEWLLSSFLFAPARTYLEDLGIDMTGEGDPDRERLGP